ncbi:hypothetical protein Cni_G25275 [Canna indica]|uniref:DUF4283 domain-containing protein n=1 Tax=Canna indica TaxID=4628 RepID=A0AAQ3KWQ7_9LILI|nr:hypothetical protein Cni_G25275 [Canna indica]
MRDVSWGENGGGYQSNLKSRRSVDEPFSWASLFRRIEKDDYWRNSEELKQKIKKIQESAKGKVTIDDAEIDLARADYKWVLYGKFFGRTPTLEMVRTALPRIWKLNNECKIVYLVAGYFAFNFECESDYWEVVFGDFFD